MVGLTGTATNPQKRVKVIRRDFAQRTNGMKSCGAFNREEIGGATAIPRYSHQVQVHVAVHHS